MSRPLCIYHGNCADGFTAAWVVRNALTGDVDFHPGVYGEAPPDVAGRDVVMVDFSYKRPVLEMMAHDARSILILDHHKTAQADLAGIDTPRPWADHLHEATYAEHGYWAALFDMDRSGAQLAWDYFYPDETDNRPGLVDFVADRDMWRFDLLNSREIAAWVFSHDYTFETWDEIARRIMGDFLACVAEGRAIERKHHKDIRELLKVTRREMNIGGYCVPVANLPYTMASDAAGKMAEDAPFAACYFDRPGGRVFSLRSRGEDAVDVSEVAASYGGGGHRNAAGFQMPVGWEGE